MFHMVSSPPFQVVFVYDVLSVALRAIAPGSGLHMANNNMGIRLFQQKSMFFYSPSPKTLIHTPSFPNPPSKSGEKGEGVIFSWILYQLYI
jgi:hypothetical protein